MYVRYNTKDQASVSQFSDMGVKILGAGLNLFKSNYSLDNFINNIMKIWQVSIFMRQSSLSFYQHTGNRLKLTKDQFNFKLIQNKEAKGSFLIFIQNH